MAKYIKVENVLTDDKIHTLPASVGNASGKLIVFVEDIEKVPTEEVYSKEEVLKMLNEIEETLGVSRSFSCFMARQAISKAKDKINH